MLIGGSFTQASGRKNDMRQIFFSIIVSCVSCCTVAGGDFALDVLPPTQRTETGTDVQINSRFGEQESGATGELSLQIKYQGGLRAFEDKAGQHYDIFRNSDSTIVGFNFMPAVEVNQVFLVVKAQKDNLVVIPNLAESIFTDLKAAGKKLDQEDKGYFFLETIKGTRMVVQYRGPKMENSPLQPFQFEVDVSRDATLKVIQSSIRPL
jgi:hypothetical protein